MAALNTLQIFNAVMTKIGEEQVENLNNLSGIQSVAWDNIIDSLFDICCDQDTRLSFLEADGVIPLTTGNYKYLISGLTYGADMQVEDTESFLIASESQKIKYRTPQEFDADYPGGIANTRYGLPTEYTKHAGYIIFNNQATAGENGKSVAFRYWKLPTILSISTPTTASILPQPFERTLLVPMAAMKTLAYLGNDEAAVYKMMVFGDNGEVEGTLNKLKRLYSSPRLKPRVKFIF